MAKVGQEMGDPGHLPDAHSPRAGLFNHTRITAEREKRPPSGHTTPEAARGNSKAGRAQVSGG